MRNAIVFSLILILIPVVLVSTQAQEIQLKVFQEEIESVPIMIAFLGGVISLLSPCSLILLLGYFTLLFADVKSKVSRSLAFFAGLSLVWILFGLTASGVGSLLEVNKDLLMQVAGVMIILFGLSYLFNFQIHGFNFKRRISSSLSGMFTFGVLFAFGWTPCVGPILTSVLVMASVSESLFMGGRKAI